jgi:hypothetical protein
MQQHLNEGCKPCAATLQIWHDVMALAGQESELTPPAEAVHLVKSQFALAGAAANRSARLVFDSLLQPATIGVRGLASARQLLYETAEFSIDLRLQPHPQPSLTSVIGQVLSRVRGSHPTNAIPVRLCTKDTPIVETLTNEFGEFHLEFEDGHDLQLAIGWDRKNAILLPLTGVKSQRTGGLRNQC